MAQQQHVRVQLKPTGEWSGTVDGAWWPRSRDLERELPTLLEALVRPFGRVEHINYRTDEWDDALPLLSSQKHSVELRGHNTEPHNVVSLLGNSPARLVLLVVPPEVETTEAHVMLAAAAGEGSPTPQELLASDQSTAVLTRAERRWDNEGGSL